MTAPGVPRVVPGHYTSEKQARCACIVPVGSCGPQAGEPSQAGRARSQICRHTQDPPSSRGPTSINGQHCTALIHPGAALSHAPVNMWPTDHCSAHGRQQVPPATSSTAQHGTQPVRWAYKPKRPRHPSSASSPPRAAVALPWHSVLEGRYLQAESLPA